MWERAARSGRPARDFAQAHHLNYAGSVPVADAHVPGSLPFAVTSPRHCASGDWRGRTARRFEMGHYTVETMSMPVPLPTLHVIPRELDTGALILRGRVTSTGDVAFDHRWSLFTDDEDFTAALLTPGMREALMHPAAEGRAVTFSGDQVSSWVYGEASWDEARVRLEFLAVLVGRVAPEVRQRFGPPSPSEPVGPPALIKPAENSTFVPAPEQSTEAPQWVVARLPEPVDARQGPALSDTGEFHVALLQASLEGKAFIPEPLPAEAERQGSWRVAPGLR